MDTESYKRRIQHTDIGDSTISSRMSALRSLDEFVEGEPEPEDVEEWVDHLLSEYEDDNISSGTMRQYFNSIKNYYQTMGHDYSDIEHIKEWLPTVSTDSGDVFTIDEWREFTDNVNNIKYQLIYEIMYKYARRPEEVISLKLSDLDLKSGDGDSTITFTIKKKRDVVRAKYTLFEGIESNIRKYISYKHGYTDLQEACKKDEPLFKGNSGQISYNAVYQDFTKRVANIDIDKKLSPKQIRHSRATHLDRSGHDTSSIVRNQLVHSPKTDLSSTYIHEGGEEYVREPMTIDDEE